MVEGDIRLSMSATRGSRVTRPIVGVPLGEGLSVRRFWKLEKKLEKPSPGVRSTSTTTALPLSLLARPSPQTTMEFLSSIF